MHIITYKLRLDDWRTKKFPAEHISKAFAFTNLLRARNITYTHIFEE